MTAPAVDTVPMTGAVLLALIQSRVCSICGQWWAAANGSCSCTGRRVVTAAVGQATTRPTRGVNWGMT
jgi:hypothetical protein